jgi:hypothetical protein
MIDRTTGSIDFESPPFRADTRLRKTEFSSTSTGKIARLLIANGEWSTFWFFASARGHDFGVLLTFHGERLETVSLKLRRNAQSWGSWSNETEHQDKLRHDAAIAEELGTPPYEFAWGSVASDIDTKTGDSSITVRYTYGGIRDEKQ